MKRGNAQINPLEESEEYEELSKLLAHETADLYQSEQDLSRMANNIAVLSPFAVSYTHLVLLESLCWIE